MRTAYCPKNHTELASASAGPSDALTRSTGMYRMVDVVISRPPRNFGFRVHICESWGAQCDGYRKENGRMELTAEESTLPSARRQIASDCENMGFFELYVTKALDVAFGLASEKLEKEIRARTAPTPEVTLSFDVASDLKKLVQPVVESSERSPDEDEAAFQVASSIIEALDGFFGKDRRGRQQTHAVARWVRFLSTQS